MKFEFACVLEKEKNYIVWLSLKSDVRKSHQQQAQKISSATQPAIFFSAVMDLQPREHKVTKESLLVGVT